MKLTHLTVLCATVAGCGLAVKLLLLTHFLAPVSTVAIVVGILGALGSYLYSEHTGSQTPPA